MVNAAKDFKPAPMQDLARGMNDARLFNLYDAGEPMVDDVVINADALEAMLDAPIVKRVEPLR